MMEHLISRLGRTHMSIVLLQSTVCIDRLYAKTPTHTNTHTHTRIVSVYVCARWREQHWVVVFMIVVMLMGLVSSFCEYQSVVGTRFHHW